MSVFKIFRRTTSTYTEAIRNFLKTSEDGFDGVLKNLKIISCENGKCSAELKVGEEHTNPMKGLHGGLSATLVDSVSSFALLTHEKSLMIPSVSVDMHMTYLKGAIIGDEIVIDAYTLKAGKSLAYLKCVIKNKETGDILVRGSHTKYIMRPQE